MISSAPAHRTLARLFAAALLLFPAASRAQISPSESLGKMKPAAGLEVSLFAAEPDLFNPTAMDVDAEGRVWVAEAVNYRIFNQPVTRPEGDRIQVLEDTDGDGRADKSWTYYQDKSLQAPLGVAVLGARVLVCQSPDLFYLEDTDGDGKADKRTPVLSGFKGADHDHAIHGAHFGPDGLIYMTNGDEGLDVTDKSGRRAHAGRGALHKAGTALRTDLEGKHLELLAEGLRNPYEPAIDSFGNLFASDNDDDGNEQVRIVYIMKGGDYGYWPKRRGDKHSGDIHWNEDRPGVIPKILRTGFGSPTGLLFYEGDLLPERWRRSLIHADAGPGVVRSYILKPEGAGYLAEMETLLECPEDKWFRPSDVCAAPDGSIFVADWYDPGVGGHQMKDTRQGRIYRLAPPGSAYKFEKADLTTRKGVAAALASPNLATRFLAHEAFAKNEVRRLDRALGAALKSKDPVLRARALWLMAPRGKDGDRALRAALAGKDAELRLVALRILARRGPEALEANAERIHEALGMEGSAPLRRELLLELAGAKPEWTREWRLALASEFDGQDRFYREAVGIAMKGWEAEAFRALAAKAPRPWDARMTGLALQLHPPDALAPALELARDASRTEDERAAALEVIAAIGAAEAGEALGSFLRPAAPPALRAAALRFLARDADGPMGKALRPAEIGEALLAALNDDATRASAVELINYARLSALGPALSAFAVDSANSAEARAAALGALRGLAAAEPTDAFAKLLSDVNPELSGGAARALAAAQSDAGLAALESALSADSTPASARKQIVEALGTTRSGCLLLLRMGEEGRLPQSAIFDASRVANASPREDIRLMAAQILPPEETREGKRLPPVAELLKMEGKPEAGRAVFYSEDRSQCFRCHAIAGEGKTVGPDLTKIGAKYGRDGLLESILNPSAAIQHEYQVWVLRTKSQGYVNGYIRSEDAGGVELVDATGASTRFAADDIVERTKSAASLMPTGLASGMTAQELVDLTAYLATLK